MRLVASEVTVIGTNCSEEMLVSGSVTDVSPKAV